MKKLVAGGTLYHYCSLSTFLSITSSKTVWLSDLMKSNDDLEGIWIYEFIERTIKKIKDDYSNRLPMQKKDEEQALTEFGIYAKVLREWQMSQDIPCGFCLSEEKDLLSQWRGYADDGRGVAIGFDVNFFNWICSSEVFQNIMSFHEVVYDESEQEQFVLDEWKRIRKAAENFQKTSVVVQNDDAPNLYRLAVFFKNTAFKEEREWRLVFNDMRNNKNYGNPAFESGRVKLSERKWYTRGNKLVPYHSLNFEKELGAIKEIILGPKCAVEEKDLQAYLDDVGFDSKAMKIMRSSASYR